MSKSPEPDLINKTKSEQNILDTVEKNKITVVDDVELLQEQAENGNSMAKALLNRLNINVREDITRPKAPLPGQKRKYRKWYQLKETLNIY